MKIFIFQVLKNLETLLELLSNALLVFRALENNYFNKKFRVLKNLKTLPKIIVKRIIQVSFWILSNFVKRLRKYF